MLVNGAAEHRGIALHHDSRLNSLKLKLFSNMNKMMFWHGFGWRWKLSPMVAVSIEKFVNNTIPGS